MQRKMENNKGVTVLIFIIYIMIPFEDKPSERRLSSLEKNMFSCPLILGCQKQNPEAPKREFHLFATTTAVQ